MDTINGIIDFFRNITQNQIIDYGIALAIIFVFFIISRFLSYLIIKMFKFREKDKEVIKSNAFYKPLKSLFIIIGVYIAVMIVKLPQNIMDICTKIFKIILILIASNAAVNFVDPKKGIVKKLRDEDKIDGNKTMASFTSRVLRVIIYIITVFLILYVFGIDLSGLVTSLGVVSAVVVLAAQDIAKDIMSGISIISDKPFLVGDWIAVGVNEGEVLEISFRSTKIKTSDNSIVTIQNSIFTTNNVINWSRLKQRRFLLNLKLPLETNSDKIDRIINRIKFVLHNNEDVDQKTIQVHFDTIGLDNININIYLYTDIIAYTEFLSFKERINRDILKVLESEEIKMAYPGQNVYVHHVDDSENKKENIIQENNNN
jgi:MscS family membrane protein